MGRCAAKISRIPTDDALALTPRGAILAGVRQSQNRVGIIGGSGLYQMEGIESPRWRTVTTPFGPPSDQVLTGRLMGRDVVFLPRHGRGHRILPTELNHRANIWAMKKLGVRWIISVSAVGSLQRRLRPCDMVLIDQFIDRTKQSTNHTFFGDGIVAHIPFAEPICENLRQCLRRAARRCQVRHHDRGTYVNMEGPAFSTRAESLANHRAGFDVIGMTNLGEARCAREAEISFATLALVTDYDCWKPEEEPVTVEMVVSNLRRNVTQAQAVIREVLREIPVEAAWDSHQSLKTAIMTDRACWPRKTITRLRPILAPYL